MGQHQAQPRTQALSSTLLAGENTLAGAGHVTHTKLIAYQGDGKVSGLILRKSPNCGMGPNFCIATTPTFLKEVVNILQESGRVPHNALYYIYNNKHGREARDK